MNCPACGVENPEDNRFCGACGACGTENPADNKFCSGCGVPLAGQPELEAAETPAAPEPGEDEAATGDAAPQAEAERRQLTVIV